MAKTSELTRVIQSFFQSYLPMERGLSTHTVKSYRDTLKLYLQYLAKKKSCRIESLSLNDLTAKSVLGFLESIEKDRNNGPRTRNQRLAVLKTYFSYLLTQDVTRADQFEKIQHLTSKREPRRPMEYLTEKELRAILESIDRSGFQGIRDYALFLTLYNTGARVQELCDLKVKHLRLHKPAMVILTGKGNKTRNVPLWDTTVQALAAHIDMNSKSEEDFIFRGKRGDPLSRFGIRYLVQAQVNRAKQLCPSLKTKKIGPHTFRHTTAMHLLQAGVDINVIKTWLGHEDLETTNKYIEIDMKMKESALERIGPKGTGSEIKKILDREKDVLKWLESI